MQLRFQVHTFVQHFAVPYWGQCMYLLKSEEHCGDRHMYEQSLGTIDREVGKFSSRGGSRHSKGYRRPSQWRWLLALHAFGAVGTPLVGVCPGVIG